MAERCRANAVAMAARYCVLHNGSSFCRVVVSPVKERLRHPQLPKASSNAIQRVYRAVDCMYVEDRFCFLWTSVRQETATGFVKKVSQQQKGI